MITVDPESREDPFYRYKMPSIKVKIESAGNGIKTVLVNLDVISKALERKPDEILKYVAKSLASSSISKAGKFIIMGQFTEDQLREKIDKYVVEMVLCPKCRNPETVFTVTKRSKTVKCNACGGD